MRMRRQQRESDSREFTLQALIMVEVDCKNDTALSAHQREEPEDRTSLIIQFWLINEIMCLTALISIGPDFSSIHSNARLLSIQLAPRYYQRPIQMTTCFISEELAQDQENYAICSNRQPHLPIFEVPKVFVDNNEPIFLPEEWSFKDFTIGRHLGRGGYGHIYLAKERRSGYVVALKVQFKKQLCAQNLEKSIIKEIEIQTHLDHPNIVKMYGFFTDEKRIVQILQYVSGGELYSKLKRQKDGFDERTSAKYLYQFMDALLYLHRNKIIHRDIKPENILLDADDNIKLADFGFATQIVNKRRKSFVGTTDYLSPEILGHQQYNESVDIWCLGVLAYELNSGKAPFTAEDSKTTEMRIRKNMYEIPPSFSLELRNFVKRLLVLEPVQRMRLEEAIKHPWITKNLKGE